MYFSVTLLLVSLSYSALLFAEENPSYKKATFAGGCFWCVQQAFDGVSGVVSTRVGYTGGDLPNPSYEQVGAGGTGHAESLEVVYDPSQISYEDLLTVFWHNVDPTTQDGQFCDRGRQYRSAIFYHDEEQKKAAFASKKAIEQQIHPVYTEIEQATLFYPAEEYHQKYYEKKPIRYKFYKYMCGRQQRLEELWGFNSQKNDIIK